MGYFLIPIRADRPLILLGERYFTSNALANLRAGRFPRAARETSVRLDPFAWKIQILPPKIDRDNIRSSGAEASIRSVGDGWRQAGLEIA